MDAPADRLRPLTGIRFIAALQVLLFHFGGNAFRSTISALENIRRAGYVAVSFFFILSGFVLTYYYADRLRTGGVSRRGFFLRRVCRIYPIYLLSTLICVPLAIHKPWGDLSAAFGDASVRAKLGTIVAHLVLLQAWFPRLAISWNIPGWSLCAELFFYALFPFVSQWVVRLSNRRRLLVAALALWSISLALASSYTIFDPDRVGRSSPETTHFWMCLLKFCPLSRLPEFLFGATLGQLFLRHTRAGPPHALAGGWLSTVAAMSIVVVLAHSREIPYPLLHQGLLIPLFGMLIYGLALGRGPIAALASTRPMLLLGEASFALCVLQVPLMYWTLVASGDSFAEQPRVAFFVIYFALALSASFVCHYFIERPLREWLGRLLQQKAKFDKGRAAEGAA